METGGLPLPAVKSIAAAKWPKLEVWCDSDQCIRHAAMYRKTSFGTQGPGGSRFVERIFTAVSTLKLQEGEPAPPPGPTLRGTQQPTGVPLPPSSKPVQM